jgi:hypothetical protein
MSSIKSKISKSINSNKSLKQLNTKIDKTIGYSNKNIIIGFITVVVLIYVCVKLYNWYSQGFKFNYDNNDNDNNNNNDNSVSKEIVNYSKSGNVPTMKRPFLNLYAVMKDGKEIATNIVFITHSFTRDDCEVDYNKFKSEGIHFLGLSSYSEFPGKISNPHDVLNDPNHKAYSYNYFDLTRGWCSVFREEINQKLFPKDFPRIQMGESNFAKFKTHLPDPNVEKEYDFIYICLKDNDKCTEKEP